MNTVMLWLLTGLVTTWETLLVPKEFRNTTTGHSLASLGRVTGTRKLS